MRRAQAGKCAAPGVCAWRRSPSLSALLSVFIVHKRPPPCALGPHYGVSLNPAQHAQPRGEPLDAPPSPAVRRVHRRPGNAARRRPLGGRPTPMARITALDSDISLAGGLVEPRLSRDEPRSIEERTRAAVSASHESADRSSGKSVLGLPTGGLDCGVYVLRERDLGGAPFERAPRHSLPSR